MNTKEVANHNTTPDIDALLEMRMITGDKIEMIDIQLEIQRELLQGLFDNVVVYRKDKQNKTYAILLARETSRLIEKLMYLNNTMANDVHEIKQAV